MKSLISIITILISLNIYGQKALEYFNSGNAKVKLQDYRGAIDDYTKVIIGFENLEANNFKSRGDAKYELNDFRGSIEDYTKAIN